MAAGGTGGHLFPAQALASALVRRGHTVILATDARAKTLLADFPAEEAHFLAAATLKGCDPVSFLKMGLTNAAGLFGSMRIIRAKRPAIAVGFGGYPTLPPLTAARLMRVPAIVHEANAVIGRANRSLARHAHVATSFPEVKGLTGALSVTHVGIPVRDQVREAASHYVPASDRFRLLVFGGSQGARAMSDLLPPAVERLSPAERARLDIVQQCRPEDMDRTRAAYEALGMSPELAPFFSDLPQRIASAHLVVARSGASTVAELSIIGRPSLLVPLPGAIDQDQAANASALEALGGAKRLDQADLTPERLAEELASAMNEPERLAKAADDARRLAKPDAAERLADLCERLAAPQGDTR
nr:undecaprenyldiphospho-muramoylpentapeptide beta-N-acetylglucosaminyltransferase [Acuticoccus kalidii]